MTDQRTKTELLAENECLRQRVAVLEAAEKELQAYASIVSSTQDGIALLDKDYHYLIINDAYENFSGVKRERFLGLTIAQYLGEETFTRYIKEHFDRCLQGEMIQYTEWFDYPTLGRRCAQVTYFPYYDQAQEITGVIANTRDVTTQRQAEERLGSALKEKEVLLRELYHRTKNNMQMIISMLNLQMSYTQSEEVAAIYREMEGRIRAMALVHQQLYQTQDLSRIDLQDYIITLAQPLLQSYQGAAQNIALHLDLEPVEVLIDAAIPCGLVLNELLTNALKHAFPGGRKGEIFVSLHKHGEEIELQVADNGVGVPPGFDFEHQGSMGLRSIFALIRYQLRGEVAFKPNDGVVCTVRIGTTFPRQRV